jgi:hypothetical protein
VPLPLPFLYDGAMQAPLLSSCAREQRLRRALDLVLAAFLQRVDMSSHALSSIAKTPSKTP